LQAIAERALEVPGAQRTQFLAPDGTVLADAVVTPGGQGYLVHMAMHTLDADHTYQLWGLTTAGEMVSLGVLGGHPKVASFSAGLTITKLAVTIEQANGAVAPTTSPIVLGTLRRT
jgi:anti-sigma-K factor RskA